MALKTIELNDTRDAVFVGNNFATLEGQDAVVQRIKNRLLLWLGEYFLNPSDGFDWEDLLNNGATETELKDVIRAYIQADQFIDFLTEIEVSINRAGRTAKIIFKGFTNGGENISGEVII